MNALSLNVILVYQARKIVLQILLHLYSLTQTHFIIILNRPAARQNRIITAMLLRGLRINYN